MGCAYPSVTARVWNWPPSARSSPGASVRRYAQNETEATPAAMQRSTQPGGVSKGLAPRRPAIWPPARASSGWLAIRVANCKRGYVKISLPTDQDTTVVGPMPRYRRRRSDGAGQPSNPTANPTSPDPCPASLRPLSGRFDYWRTLPARATGSPRRDRIPPRRIELPQAWFW